MICHLSRLPHSYTGTVKPPIIPAGREWRKAGNKGRMEIGGVSWQRGGSHGGQENGNICVELGYKLQRTEQRV